jgi:hypothetical protein
MGTLYTYKVQQKRGSACNEWIPPQFPPSFYSVHELNTLYYFLNEKFCKISYNLAPQQGGVDFYKFKFNKYEGPVSAFNLSAKIVGYMHK